MTTIGRNKAVVELPGKIKFGGVFGWLSWVFVHLFSIIGMRRAGNLLFLPIGYGVVLPSERATDWYCRGIPKSKIHLKN